MMYMTFFVLLVVAVQLSAGDISGRNPSSGSCLCVDGSRVNVRRTPCQDVIASVNSGQCYTYRGEKRSCFIGSNSYNFFRIKYGTSDAWIAGDFLNVGSSSQCGQGGPGGSDTNGGNGGSISGSYKCHVTDSGLRVNEESTTTSFECKAKDGSYSCIGGQCVAYVKCYCTQNGYFPPQTSCWAPGPKVIVNGRCNENIPINTAVATFGSSNNYIGHAGVYRGCQGGRTIKLFDQYCCGATKERLYDPDSRFYNNFAVITNKAGCAGVRAKQCRTEPSGTSCCPA